jgi:hypothetical protein
MALKETFRSFVFINDLTKRRRQLIEADIGVSCQILWKKQKRKWLGFATLSCCHSDCFESSCTVNILYPIPFIVDSQFSSFK